jgi:CheY-like chemotaxis protein
MPWLFEPLFSSRSEHHPLRGLGLPLARAIAEGHGGWLEIRSRPGEGTFADLFLPLEAGVVDRSSEGMPANGTVEGASTKSIILIEDEPLLARLLEQTLARAGYDVELFTTQQESERHFQSGGGEADLMIVERILAGGRSGMEIARDWQRRQPSLKVMMIDRGLSSGFAHTESDSDAVGPTVTPPFVPQDIVRRVKEMLGGADEIARPQSEEFGAGPLKAH